MSYCKALLETECYSKISNDEIRFANKIVSIIFALKELKLKTN